MKILHLEDEGPLRDVFKTAVSTFNKDVEVIQFISSDDALEYIGVHSDSIGVFVLDIRVPGQFDGLQVAAKIREIGNDHRIIITSGYITPDRDYMRNLKIEWMPKPMHLLNVVQKILPWVYAASKEQG